MKEANLKGLHSVWFQLWDILEKTKLWRRWKDQWLPGIKEERRVNRKGQRSLGQWNYSEWYYNGWFMSLDICPNPQNIPHHELNSNENYGHEVVMICQCRFMNSSSIPLRWGCWQWGDCACVEAGGVGESPYPMLNFAVNLKLF